MIDASHIAGTNEPLAERNPAGGELTPENQASGTPGIEEARPAAPQSPEPVTSPADLDRAIEQLGANAASFAAMPPREKAGLLRELVARIAGTAAEQVAAACHAKGLDPASPAAGEEWIAGPYATLSNARLLAESLDDIAAKGRPHIPRRAVRVRDDGRVEVSVFPQNAKDKALFAGFEAYVLLREGATRETVTAEQATFYQQGSSGGVSLVLGAGNVASISPMDALHKLFVEGKVVLLKMSPVNAYLGPLFEHAFAPLIERGLLRIAYGGGEVGAYLAAHSGISDIHITGSAATHDLIVWGPPGPERDRRKAAHDPQLKKAITSELGNVSPILVMPTYYSEDELWFQARSVATQVVNNASFNCNAAKMLVLPKGWPQRALFLGMIERALSSVPPRKAYYPGASDRYDRLTGGRERAKRFGASGATGATGGGGGGAEGTLPWTFVAGLDAGDRSEPLFSTEPFCGVLSEVEVGSTDPVEFITEATRFCNERLWGTLSCAVIAHPVHERDPAIAKALDRAILDLRYGAVAINHWPALLYGLVVPPWGGHPSATLADVQSGIGFVHNTLMLGGIEKAVVRGPLKVFPKPPFFYDNRRMRDVGERLTAYSASPSWGKVFGIARTALRG